MRRLIFMAAAVLLTASCGTISNSITRESQYPEMYSQMPATLLIMPPINNTSNVEAKDLLYTSISRPLAEAGYYVISPLLAMDILKSESAYDAELFVEAPLTIFREYFGADAVVFSEINTWAKTGVGIETNIRYFIRSTASGDIIFDRSCDLYLDLQVDSGTNTVLGALLDLAVSAIATATTDHIVAARQANYYIFSDIPQGRYSPLHLQDREYAAQERNISARVSP